MIKKRLLFSLIVLYSLFAFAQSHLAFSTGLSIDINNKGKFKQIPVSVQWLPGHSKAGSFIVEVNVALPLGYNAYDSAYTLTVGMPSAIAVQKNIKNLWFSFCPGFRFYVYAKSQNILFLDIFPVALSWQKFTVDYRNYDKADYNVLNPDVNTKQVIWCSGASVGYYVHNWMLQLHGEAPWSTINSDYSLSYKLNAPLQFTVGYLLLFHKKEK